MQQKLTQHCKSTLLQLKKKREKKAVFIFLPQKKKKWKNIPNILHSSVSTILCLIICGAFIKKLAICPVNLDKFLHGEEGPVPASLSSWTHVKTASQALSVIHLITFSQMYLKAVRLNQCRTFFCVN